MIRKYLDVSTAHVEEYFYTLNLPFRFESHEHGWIIFIGDELDEDEVKSLQDQNAQYLVDLLKYAREHECGLINLDSDADKIDGLKCFTW